MEARKDKIKVVFKQTVSVYVSYSVKDVTSNKYKLHFDTIDNIKTLEYRNRKLYLTTVTGIKIKIDKVMDFYIEASYNDNGVTKYRRYYEDDDLKEVSSSFIELD